MFEEENFNITEQLKTMHNEFNHNNTTKNNKKSY